MTFEEVVAAMRALLLSVTRDLVLADCFEAACLKENKDLRSLDESYISLFKNGGVSVGGVLLCSFVWHSSPNGYAYWKEMFQTYGKRHYVVAP